jgi:hypothetical protein
MKTLFGRFLKNSASLLLTLLLTINYTLLTAQTTKRIELPATTEGYHTVSLGQNGVVLVSQINKNAYLIQKYDNDLRQVWSINGVIEDNLSFVKSSYDGQSVYLLFSRSRADYYQVVKVNVSLGFLETFYLTSVDKFQITDFQTLGYSVFMAGTIREEPMLLYTHLKTKQSKVLRGPTQTGSVIQSVEVDTSRRLVNVSYAIRKNRDVKITAYTFDEDGQSLGQVSVTPESDYSLLNGRLFILNDSTKLMIGTYGFKNMQSNNGAVSQGLFLSKIIFDEVEYTNYQSFTDFENFFNFMSQRERDRIDKRIERKKEGGNELKLNYRFLVHDIIAQGKNYLISGEVFYPEYRTNNNSPYGMSSMFGSPFYSPLGFYPLGWGFYNPYLYDPFYSVRRSNQVLTGFVYTHAIVAAFDENGKLRWDNCLPFENLKTTELKERTRLKINDDNTVAMFYSNKGSINAKIFDQNKTLADRPPIAITTEDANDRIRQTNTDDVRYWYNNYYLATGYQRISGPDGRRNVFYLNKVSF